MLRENDFVFKDHKVPVQIDILKRAKQILEIEQQALKEVQSNLDKNFLKVIHALLNSKGRIIVTAVGKSGIIAQKIASTFRSTGSKAYYIHSAEAIHGDLGSIDSMDIVLALSNSGTTSELLNIIPNIKKIGAKLIAMTGNVSSPLASQSDYILPVVVKKEACSFNLAPTSSSTAMLAMGDCLALVLSESKKFSSEEFFLYHPGGNIGKNLSTFA